METKNFLSKLSWCIAKYSEPNNRIATSFSRYVKKSKDLSLVEKDCVSCYVKYISGKQGNYKDIMLENIVILGENDQVKLSAIYSMCEDKTVATEILILYCKIVLKAAMSDEGNYDVVNSDELAKLKKQCSWDDTTESESTDTDSESSDNEMQIRMQSYLAKVYLDLGDEIQEAIFGSKQPPPDGITYVSK